jgi:sn-glycerol 3-phosphate transport system substrate-binding protein
MRKTLRSMVLAVVLVVLAVAPLATLAQDEIVIDFYFPTAVDGPIAAKMQEYADQFNAANPGIVVNPVYSGDYNGTRDVILTEINAEDVIVDVAVMLAIDLFSFIEDGTIVAAQDFIDASEDGEAYVADFFPAMLANSVDENGMVWSIPFQRSTPLLYYNADLLAEAGFDAPPTNNEELIEIAQALTTEERAGLMVPVAGVFPSWLFQSFAAAYGQPLVGENPAEVYLNTPEALSALEFVTKLGISQEEGGFGVGPLGGSAWGDTPTAFTSGAAAMIYHTSGSLGSILANADFEVGAAFLPSGPAGDDGTGYGSPMGGGNLYIFNDGSKSEAELEAAWAWVQFLSSPEIQADWSASNGYIAARQSAWDLEPLKSLAEEFPQYTVARDQLAFAVKEFSAYRTIDLQNIVNNALSSVISGSVPLSEAATVLEEAQAQIDSILADYQ